MHKISFWQEEIDGLIRENEELKSKNQSLEDQLKTALLPCNLNTEQPDDKRVSLFLVEEWKNKLQAATDVCDKIKHDMDKMREVICMSRMCFIVQLMLILLNFFDADKYIY